MKKFLASLCAAKGRHLYLKDLEEARMLLTSWTFLLDGGVAVVNHSHERAVELLSYIQRRGVNKRISVVIASDQTDDAASELCKHFEAHAVVPLGRAEDESRRLLGMKLAFS